MTGVCRIIPAALPSGITFMNARESPREQQPREQNIQRPAGNNGFDLGRMLGGIKLDEEKIIIILLIVILARNGADLPLLAALGYLLL